jgi:3-deoxy-D-manno-octulosonic-acid transferase
MPAEPSALAWRLSYQVLIHVAAALLLPRLAWKARANPAYRQDWTQRLRAGPPMPAAGRIWIHAVSVGEVTAARPIVDALRERLGNPLLLITTTTPTGRAAALRHFGATVEHRYLPLDLPWLMPAFLAAIQPRAAVMMETEIWPNLYRACRTRGIPLLLANARLSPRSQRRYQRVRPLVREALQCLSGLAAQSQADAERFLALGMPATRVRVLGNTKWDAALAAARQQVQSAPAVRLNRGRPIWVAASTHDGEEPILLDAHQRLLAAMPDALLILAPRHPERFAQAYRRALEHGLRASLRSRGAPTAQDQVWVADSMGELGHWYSQADVAFIGGSLVPAGGQNPIEAAAFGIPVLSGPAVDNFAEVHRRLGAGGGLAQVSDSASLCAALLRLLGDPARRRRDGDRLREALTGAAGAATATVDWLLALAGIAAGSGQSERG